MGVAPQAVLSMIFKYMLSPKFIAGVITGLVIWIIILLAR